MIQRDRKMKKKGIIRTAAVMLAAAAMFTGCSGGKQQETTQAAAAQETTAAAAETTAAETTAEETKAEETKAAETAAAEAETTAPAKAAIQVPAGGTITDRQALEIALQHAGVQESSISRQEIKMDYEHGKQVFEVGFHVGRTEYDYDIDAASGEILEFEVDTDD